MKSISDIYYNVKKSISQKIDKKLEGKNKELIFFSISMFVNFAILIGFLILLVFTALQWMNKPLYLNLIILYVSTILILFSLRNIIKDIKKHKVERVVKPKKTSTERINEQVDEEMKKELED